MSKRVEESDLLIPALRIVRDNPNCNTTFIYNQLVNQVALSDGDLEILAGRTDTKFSQVVRNLTGSHYEVNEFGKCTIRSETRPYTFKINQHGFNVINKYEVEDLYSVIDDISDLDEILEETEYDEISDIDEANNRIPTVKENGKRKRYKTDYKLSKTALIKCNFICEYASIHGLNHQTFDCKHGKQYLEGHHLIPMKAQKDFGMKNLDRIENIVGLCPLCHARVHHGTLQEKIKVLKPLYDARIKALNECEHHIEITFEELINKYYL